MWARVGLAAAIAAPLVAVPFVGRAVADSVGRTAGDRLAILGAALAKTHDARDARAPLERGVRLEPTEGESTEGESAQTIGAGDPEAPLSAIKDASSPPRARGDRARQERDVRSPHRGILVRSDLVARAVRSGARPSGAVVAASGMRPTGVALQGVGAFGTGLQDGDVVTAVGGTATTSVGMVVAAVAGAVRAKAKAISAVVWRDQQEIRVTVEIPSSAKLRRGAELK